MLSNFQLETTDIGFAEEPVLNHRCPGGKAEEAYPARLRSSEAEICFFWQECRTNEKAQLLPQFSPGPKTVEQTIAAGADVKHKNKQQGRRNVGDRKRPH